MPPTRTRARKTKRAVAEPKQQHGHEVLRGLVQGVAGESGGKILQNMGDGATDEFIADKSGLKLAQVRSLLNHLHSYGIVEYTREKNIQTGWFTYTWRKNLGRFFQNFLTMKKKEYEGLRDQLSKAEGAQFYKCKKACVRMPFDRAMEIKFKCPGCRQVLNFVRSEDELAQLEHHIGALENVLTTRTTEQAPSGLAR